jgi:hypothetical protein
LHLLTLRWIEAPGSGRRHRGNCRRNARRCLPGGFGRAKAKTTKPFDLCSIVVTSRLSARLTLRSPVQVIGSALVTPGAGEQLLLRMRKATFAGHLAEPRYELAVMFARALLPAVPIILHRDRVSIPARTRAAPVSVEQRQAGHLHPRR